MLVTTIPESFKKVTASFLKFPTSKEKNSRQSHQPITKYTKEDRNKCTPNYLLPHLSLQYYRSQRQLKFSPVIKSYYPFPPFLYFSFHLTSHQNERTGIHYIGTILPFSFRRWRLLGGRGRGIGRWGRIELVYFFWIGTASFVF